LVPVTVGLTASSATVIATTSDYSWVAVAITAGAALTAYPLWTFAAAALLGLIGLV